MSAQLSASCGTLHLTCTNVRVVVVAMLGTRISAPSSVMICGVLEPTTIRSVGRPLRARVFCQG